MDEPPTPDVLVIGCGKLGPNICAELVRLGVRVLVHDTHPEKVNACRTLVSSVLAAAEGAGVVSPGTAESAPSLLMLSTEVPGVDGGKESVLEGIARVYGESLKFCVEAVSEDATIKTKLFLELDRLFPPEVILLTNTVSIPVDPMARSLKVARDRLLICRFLAPVIAIPRAELASSAYTSHAAYATTHDWLQRLNKLPFLRRPGYRVLSLPQISRYHALQRASLGWIPPTPSPPTEEEEEEGGGGGEEGEEEEEEEGLETLTLTLVLSESGDGVQRGVEDAGSGGAPFLATYQEIDFAQMAAVEAGGDNRGGGGGEEGFGAMAVATPTATGGSLAFVTKHNIAFSIECQLNVIPWGDLRLDADVGREIGAGAGGSVLLGLYKGSPVAVKVMVSMADVRDVEDVVEEAGILARLRHPNICLMMGLSVTSSSLGLVMELCTGRDLGAQMRARVASGSPPFSLLQRSLILRDIARALAYLHAFTTPHRDLKPGNVLVTGSGQIKLGDFGISGSNRSFRGAGTPRYAAPEVKLGAEASCRSDIYAFGLLIYEITTLLRVPVPSHPNAFHPPPKLDDESGDALEELYVSATAQEPGDRPSAEAVLGVVEDVLVGVGVDPLLAEIPSDTFVSLL